MGIIADGQPGRIFGICVVAIVLAGCGEGSSSSSSDAATASASVSNSSIASIPPVGLVALSSSAYTVAPSSSAVVTISRSGPPAGSVTVGYTTVDGTATSGTDYSPTSGTVTWENGDSSGKTVRVPVTSLASSKYFAFALTSVAGHASFGSPATAAVEISASAASSSSSGGSSSSGSSSGSSSSGSSSSGGASSGSSSSGVTANTTTGTGSIKWHPGHYMASYTVLGPGETISTIQGELNDLANSPPEIKGYRVLVAWSAITDTVQGSYNWALLDSIMSYMDGIGKQLVLVVLPGAFSTGNLTSAPASWIGVPSYILNNPIYGPSPFPGQYGWWGPGANEGNGPAVAAFWRTPGEYGGGSASVMTEYTNTLTAIAARYNNNPNFEGIMYQEDAWISSITMFAGSDYNSNNLISNLETSLAASVANFTTSNVIMENTYMPPSDAAESFEAWMIANRVAPGSADTVGQTAFNNGYQNTNLGLAWGLQAYMGITTPGGTYTGPNYRPRARAMLDVEAQELIGSYYKNWTSPNAPLNGTLAGSSMNGFTPLDIIDAANTTYGASHLFWTHFFGTETFGSPSFTVPTQTAWSNLQNTLAANPLTNTAYPANYP
jgi:hypothetical protein